MNLKDAWKVLKMQYERSYIYSSATGRQALQHLLSTALEKCINFDVLNNKSHNYLKFKQL